MTEIDRALDRINEIHHHIARTEVYRGFRSVPIAISGVIGLAGGALQSQLMKYLPGWSWSFVIYWAGVAAVAFAIVLYWDLERKS